MSTKTGRTVYLRRALADAVEQSIPGRFNKSSTRRMMSPCTWATRQNVRIEQLTVASHSRDPLSDLFVQRLGQSILQLASARLREELAERIAVHGRASLELLQSAGLLLLEVPGEEPERDALATLLEGRAFLSF